VNNHLQMVIFLHRQVHTGGQRYLFEVFSYLQRQGVKVIPIYLDDFPKWVRRLGLLLDCLICNLWSLKQVHNIASLDKVIFFEDVYLRPRLFIFKMLVSFKNN
jgi:hypothetical protein